MEDNGVTVTGVGRRRRKPRALPPLNTARECAIKGIGVPALHDLLDESDKDDYRSVAIGSPVPWPTASQSEPGSNAPTTSSQSSNFPRIMVEPCGEGGSKQQDAGNEDGSGDQTKAGVDPCESDVCREGTCQGDYILSFSAGSSPTHSSGQSSPRDGLLPTPLVIKGTSNPRVVSYFSSSHSDGHLDKTELDLTLTGCSLSPRGRRKHSPGSSPHTPGKSRSTPPSPHLDRKRTPSPPNDKLIPGRSSLNNSPKLHTKPIRLLP